MVIQGIKNKFLPPIALFSVEYYLGKLTAISLIRTALFFGLVASLIFIIVAPILGLYICPLLDLWFSSTHIKGFPPRSYFLFGLLTVIGMKLALTEQVKWRVSPKTKDLVKIALVFYLWMVIVDFVPTPIYGRSFGIPYLRIFLGRIIGGFFIAFLVQYLITTKDKLRVFVYLILFGMMVSSLIALLQFFRVEAAWQIRFLVAPFPSLDLSSKSDYLLQGTIRSIGLAGYSIPFSYQLVSVLPLAFSLAINNTSCTKFEKLYLWIATVLITLALFANNTRSALLGCLIGFFCIIILSKKTRKTLVNSASLIMILLLIFFKSVSIPDYILHRMHQLKQESALCRVPLTLGALKVAIDHPLGVGKGGYSQAAKEYYRELSYLPGAEVILKTGTHNQFLNALVNYGIPGLLLLLLFYQRIFSGLNYFLRNREDPFLKAVAIGIYSMFISYIIHSLFHNAGPFGEDPFNWYFIGILMVLLNFVGHKTAKIKG